MASKKQVTSHFCAPVLYFVSMGTIWILAIKYRFQHRKTGDLITQIKFPGGMARKNGIDETTEDALNREAGEEIFKSKVNIMQYCKEDPIVLTFPSDSPPEDAPQGYVSNELHEKCFFLIDARHIPDTIRDWIKWEDDGVELGIPRFYQVSELAGRDGVLFKHHQPALACLIHFMKGLPEEYGDLETTLDPDLSTWSNRIWNENEQRELALLRS